MIPVAKLNFHGGYAENGRKLGRALKQSERFKGMIQFIKQYGALEQDENEIIKVFCEFCPQLLDELDGLSAGLDLSRVETLRLFAGYDMPVLKEMGCTSFMTKDYYVRNYDFGPQIYDGLFITQKYQDGKRIGGNSQMIIGRLDGMNQSGLVVGLHFVSNAANQKGFLCSTIVRILLETCENTKDAIHLLKKLPHAASYNYSLLDRDGSFAVFEATPESYSVRFGEEKMGCVNSFGSETLKSYNRPESTSENRLQTLEEIDEKQLCQRDIHQYFSHKESPLFYSDYENFFGTLYTVSYMPKDSKVLLTAAGDKTEEFNI